MNSRWIVKNPMNKPVASGPISTIASDEVVRKMYHAGYKTYVDGKLYRPRKEQEKRTYRNRL
jgi:hypothetical protein